MVQNSRASGHGVPTGSRGTSSDFVAAAHRSASVPTVRRPRTGGTEAYSSSGASPAAASAERTRPASGPRRRTVIRALQPAEHGGSCCGDGAVKGDFQPKSRRRAERLAATVRIVFFDHAFDFSHGQTHVLSLRPVSPRKALPEHQRNGSEGIKFELS